MFLTALTLRHLEGQRRWQLTNPLSYETWTSSILTVPKGFITDGASIPRIFWALFPPTGIYLEAAVLHDHFYSGHYKWMLRLAADKLFLEAMEDLGVSWWKRKIIWAAVRVGGSFSWRGMK